MQLVTGNIALFESTIEKPLQCAKNFEDRLPSCHHYVRYLSLSGRFEEAVDKCFSILNEFGETFPSKVTPEIIQAEIANTELLLTNFPSQNLLSLPRLGNEMKLSMMETMAMLLLNVFSTKREYVPLIGCRIAQRSATYGWCSYSAFGLYSFGQVLICLMRVEEGSTW